jgi:anti-sigma factor RsiW
VTPEERDDLLAAYALGTLSGPDAAAVEQLIRGDSGARHELAAYHEIVDLIALSVPLRRADPALRERVLRAARHGRGIRMPRRWRHTRQLVMGAAAAAAVAALAWGLDTRAELRQQSRDAAAVAAIVRANAKELQQLQAAGVTMEASEDLRQQLQTAVADQQLVIAITTDRDVRTSQLDATSAGHGATARFLWSAAVGGGVLVARGLPALPLDSVYQVWLDDGQELVSGGTALPDERGSVEKVVRPRLAQSPIRVTVSVAPAGGSDAVGRIVVLSGAIER